MVGYIFIVKYFSGQLLDFENCHTLWDDSKHQSFYMYKRTKTSCMYCDCYIACIEMSSYYVVSDDDANFCLQA